VGDFKTMLGGFASLAVQLTGLQPIVQAHMPPKVLDPRKHGKLEFRVIGCRPINSTSDEIRYEYNAGTNRLIVTSIGFRRLTIQVKFTGEDNRPSQDALFYLERLGDRIVWPSSLAALRAVDMGLVTRGSFIDLSRVISAEDRQGSVGVKEFTFNVVVTEVISNPSDSPLSWIETVEFLSNTLNDVDGTPLVPQISGTVTRS
jgi:hypothetical protein